MASLFEKVLSPLKRGEELRTWPPDAVREHWEKVEGFRLRYENDKDYRLMHAPRFSGASRYLKELYTPAAVGREVCNFSADMLFSASPEIKWQEGAESGKQTVLDAVLEANGLASALPAMAALVAAEGRGGLRVYYDAEVNDLDAPLIDHVHEDEVIWNERGRFVTGGVVVITRRVKEGGMESHYVYRLVEEHSRGLIERTLYKGRESQLGEEVQMDTLRQFAGLPQYEETNLDTPTLIRWDNVSGGYSDMAGVEAMLDAIDTEITFGREKSEKSRPVSFADSRLFDERGRLDVAGIYPLKSGRLRELEEAPEKLYGTIQPEFQSAETKAWIDFLIDIGLLSMGYSKASYGRDEGGSADSGKALKMRQWRTMLKRSGKERLAVEAIKTAVAVACAWQANASEVAEFRPDVQLGDGMPRDPLEDAQEAQTWGDAISLEEKIRIRRPDWDEEQVKEEIARINEQNAARAPQVPRIPGLAVEGLDTGNGGGNGRAGERRR